jgi:hypothetical protein
MSLARLMITAVTLEGRSKSEVARDYGVSRVWMQKLVQRYEREARRVRAPFATAAFESAGGQQGAGGPDRPAPQTRNAGLSARCRTACTPLPSAVHLRGFTVGRKVIRSRPGGPIRCFRRRGSGSGLGAIRARWTVSAAEQAARIGSLLWVWLGVAAYVVVAAMWLIPDRRREHYIDAHQEPPTLRP